LVLSRPRRAQPTALPAIHHGTHELVVGLIEAPSRRADPVPLAITGVFASPAFPRANAALMFPVKSLRVGILDEGKQGILALAFVAVLVAVFGAAPAFAGRDDIDTLGERGGSGRTGQPDGFNPQSTPIFSASAVAAIDYGFLKSRDGTGTSRPNCLR